MQINRSNPVIRRPRYLLPAILLSIALGASLAVSFSHTNAAYAMSQTASSARQTAGLHDLENAFTSIVDEVAPSVVKITSEVKTQASSPDRIPNSEFFKGLPFPFSLPSPDAPDNQRPAPQATGTGFIVKADGYILTNDHVVGGSDTVSVKLKDGREFKGKVIRDTKSDLALVKIDATGLPAVRLGESKKVKVGSWAIAIGSPFGLDQTVTVGVVSAIKRQEAVENKFYPDLIQTDASINPGNSGGPLVNIDGEVIGINTLIRSSMGGGNIGIGFAIPIDTAKYVMNQLYEHGKVTRGYLGVGPVDLSPRDAETYGVNEGAYVQEVATGSPADKAGIQPEDVIIQADGTKITDSLQLRKVLESIPPGRTVKIVVVRNKVKKSIDVTIGEFKDRQVAGSPDSRLKRFGFTVDELTPDILSKLNLPSATRGVIVSDVNPSSEAARNGLRPGLVVTHVNDTAIASTQDFDDATKNIKLPSTLRLRIKTADGTMVVKFQVE